MTIPRRAEDATAASDKAGMRAAHEVNGPRFAHAIPTTEELLALPPAARENARHDETKEKRMPTGTITNLTLAQQLLDALDALFGLHPGFRPAHAKGVMCSGTFTSSPEAAKLTRAPHASRPSTPVTVRYSNATGVPTIPDNDPARSGPRGMASRFHLAEHLHTDIVAQSANGFPVRTGVVLR